MDFISKLRLKAANMLSPSIDAKMQKAIFQWLGDNGIVIPDNKTSYIDNGYNYNLLVYAIVNYTTRNGAAIPWVLKRETPNGQQIVKEHPLLDLIARPNGMYSWNEYLEQSLGYLMLTGDAMSYTVRVGAKKERVQEVYYLPSNYIEIVASGSYLDPIKEYQFSIYKDVSYNSTEIIHTKLPNYTWENGQSLYGQSPLKAGLRTLETSNENTTALKSQSANQGAKGLLMFDNQGMASSITEPQMRNFEREVKKKINGADKRGTIQATSKMFKYQQLGMSAKDLELLETSRVTKQDLCTLYGYSSILFNDTSNSTYNNMMEAKKSAYVDVIIPQTQRIVDDWNYNVVKGYDEKLSFHLDLSGVEVLQQDKAKQAEWLAKAPYISNQRKQEIMGEEIDPSFPKYLVPTNLIPADEIEINNAFNDYESQV